MHAFALLFVVFLILRLATETWLALRHVRHIRHHRALVPEAFATAVPLADHQKAADYATARTQFGVLDDWVGVAFLLLWTLGGGLELLDHTWQSLALSPLVTGTGVILSAFFIMGLLDLPFSLWQTFVIEARFGFNRTTPALFCQDLLKQTLLAILLGAPLACAALWLMRSMGADWWLYVWGLWFGFTLVMTWAWPTWIAPLFNKFTALEAGAMRSRIERLLDRTGFASKGVYVMDGSRRSAHGNAYFSGFGKGKRIVFFDTLLKQLDEDEMEAVLAHELGHFRKRHIHKRMILMAVTSLFSLGLLAWLMQQTWFFTGLGVASPSTHMALMLFLLAGPVFGFFLGPLMALSSRRHEYEADRYAVEQASGQALTRALTKLYRDNAATLTPDPLHSAFYDSHPPAALRIAALEAIR